MKGFELDEDWTFRLRRPLMMWQPEVWALGRAVRRAEASLPNGVQLFAPPPNPGLEILNQRQFDAYTKVLGKMLQAATPRIVAEARRSRGA